MKYDFNVISLQNKIIKKMNIEKFLEFEAVVILREDNQPDWESMGVAREDESTETLIKYSFDPTTIVEFRQTFVKYKGEWQDAVVCSFTTEQIETPPLLTTYQGFKSILDEYYQKNSKA